MDCEEEMSMNIKKEMDVEVKRELVLDWDEVDNCHGQIFDNDDKENTPKSVLKKLPKSVLQQYITKNPAPARKSSEFQCSKCERNYQNKYSLNAHMRYCGKEPHIKCDHCPYRTNYKTMLIVHLSKVHENGKKIESADERRLKRICEKCNETARMLSLTKCEECFGKLILHCAKCNKQFKSKSSARYHWDTRCGVRGYFNCAKCDYKSVWRAKVVAHMKRSHPSQDLTEELKNIEWLDLKHDKEKSEANKYKCPKCTKTFESSKKLSGHIFACGGSERTSNSNAEVKNRNRSVESEAIKCSTCSKVFSNNFSLNRHLRCCKGRCYMVKASDDNSDVDIDVVDANEDLPVIPLVLADGHNERYIKMMVWYCEKCQEDSPMENKTWGLSSKVQCRKCNQTLLFKCRKCLITKIEFCNLKRHFDNVCDPQEEFKCSKCDFKSPIFIIVNSHYNNVHGTANVPCQKCGKKFKSMEYLKIHLLGCGAKPQFQCAHCPYKGTQKILLRGHIFRQHMGRIDIIDRSEAIKMSWLRFTRTKFHLNAFCSECNKEQRLGERLKICKICRTKLYYKCKTCKNKYDVDDENACIHVQAYLETIKFECKHCGKGSVSKKSLCEHKRKVCGSNTIFKCRFCKYAAKTKGYTMKHEKAEHPHKF